MRVLIVYPRFYVYGGAELLIVKLCNYLTKRGVKNALLTTSMLPEVRHDLRETEIIIVKNKFSNIIGEILAIKRGICNCLDDFDVINVHNFPAEISVFPYKKPFVWMCNEPELYLILKLNNLSFQTRLLSKILLFFEKFVVKKYIKCFVVADEFNARRFKKLYGITPDIIHYGIDYDFFCKGEGERAKHRFGAAKNFTILQVGMLTPFKNQMASIKAVQELKDKITNIKLILAGWGEGEYKEMLEKYVQENNLKDYVLLTGHLKREDIRDLFHASDVLLHPIKEQGGWLSPFEALCAGKPIIVSPEMTASNIIKRENIGIVTDDYAKAIEDIYINSNYYREMAKKGREWVKENLGWDRFGYEMLEIFNKALTRTSRKRL
ncbi:MAG: glycosyltransferase family 4 protein [Nitrospinae bacterium]|nr:glycosyltransferase family 4 protein [Nitrospinota bacterium]